MEWSIDIGQRAVLKQLSWFVKELPKAPPRAVHQALLKVLISIKLRNFVLMCEIFHWFLSTQDAFYLLFQCLLLRISGIVCDGKLYSLALIKEGIWVSVAFVIRKGWIMRKICHADIFILIHMFQKLSFSSKISCYYCIFKKWSWTVITLLFFLNRVCFVENGMQCLRSFLR